MKKLSTTVLLLLTGAAPAADPVLSQSAIQSAFQILRSEYIRSSELTFEELNRAALQGLLQRLELGAELVSKLESQRPAATSGVLAERLTPEIAYMRPLTYAEGEPTVLESRLREFAAAKLPHLILDLRSAAPPGDFAVAAAILESFIPRGELLFKLKQVGRDDAQLFISSRDPVWTGPLVVLVDAETNNLGETIAAVLHARRRALLVGAATCGATVRYETLPVDNAWLLRFARAEMLLPDDSSLFKTGLKPDFAIPLPPAVKRQIFDTVDAQHPVLETLFDTARPRYNEAALVARKHPELDDYIRRSAGQSSADTSKPRDTVLQRAVDLLCARSHFDAMKLDWDSKPRTAPPTIRKAQPAP